MEDYNGIAISKNDKEFVVAFDNFVNGKMQSATNTGKALATIHRYLQSQAFKVCVAYFRQIAVNYRTGYYDERNETAARRAAMMYDTLMNGDEIYDPLFQFKLFALDDFQSLHHRLVGGVVYFIELAHPPKVSGYECLQLHFDERKRCLV